MNREGAKNAKEYGRKSMRGFSLSCFSLPLFMFFAPSRFKVERGY
jgi:hypothetical protein